MDDSPLEKAINQQVPDFTQGQNAEEFYREYYNEKPANYVRLSDKLLFLTLLENGVLLPKKKLEGQDLLDIIEQRCADLTRGQLATKHPSLYMKMRKLKILDNIPKREDKKEEISKRLLQEYHDNYEGITRGQLLKKDPALYQKLARNGLIDSVPLTEKGQKSLETIAEQKKPLQEYHEQYEGLSRGQLIKQNPALYQRLRRQGLLEHIPKGPRGRKPSVGSADILQEYHDKYAGLTRSQLAQKNSGLYQRLLRFGLIEHVPKAEREISADESLAEYHSKHSGVTRTQLQRENPGLYHRLRKYGLLEHIPKGTRGRPRDVPLQCYSEDLIECLQTIIEQEAEAVGEDDGALQEYQDKYARLTRTQLHKKDQALYNRLRRAKLLEHIPTERDKDQINRMLIQEYQDKYAGLTRGELQKQDQALYQRLRRAKLLEYVPTKDKSF